MQSDTEIRAAMIGAAERLLAASPDHDIATRAVCEAAGVTQPVLYRLFRDKRGLLDAVADHGYQRYAALKEAQERTGDPVADLKAGWDGHLAFAERHQALYRLMFTPRPWSRSTARQRVLDLLTAALERCAAAGVLAVEPAAAAPLIMSANVGVALHCLGEPALFADPALSHRMRDAVFARVLCEAPERAEPDPLAAAARRLRAQLALAGPTPLVPAESALLRHWLDLLTGTGDRAAPASASAPESGTAAPPPAAR